MNRSEILSSVIFQETTTIGIRQYAAKRSALERTMIAVNTRYGRIMMKVSRRNGAVVTVAPEYEDCARIAREHGIPLKEVQAMAVREYQARS